MFDRYPSDISVVKHDTRRHGIQSWQIGPLGSAVSIRSMKSIWFMMLMLMSMQTLTACRIRQPGLIPKL